VLNQFISANRQELIKRCRHRFAARSGVRTAPANIDHGVPLFLDQLGGALRLGQPVSADIGRSAVHHGHEMLRQGFTFSQVVHGYGDVCQAITELALELGVPIPTSDFRVLSGCLDDAIAGAVTEFGREQNQAILDGQMSHAGFLAHELRNLLQSALVAFDVIKTGEVGVAGSTGTVLNRGLRGALDLIARSVAEARLELGIQDFQRLQVSALMADVAEAATLAATVRGIGLNVIAVDDDAMIEVDRQVLTAVVMSVVQNAIKFTRPDTTVTLRVGATAKRVMITVEDECGGLPSAGLRGLLRADGQRPPARNGSELGLAFARRGAEANHGRVYARSLPGVGCVFTVDLPRTETPALPIA
jgi:signal transduction histidine kinase